MGNYFSIVAATTVDFFVASISSMFWEYIFSPYDAAKSTYISLAEGILQFAALTTSLFWGLGLFSPEGVGSELGMIPPVLFGVLFSPNMMKKLSATHSNVKTLLGFQFPSLLASQNQL